MPVFRLVATPTRTYFTEAKDAETAQRLTKLNFPEIEAFVTIEPVVPSVTPAEQQP